MLEMTNTYTGPAVVAYDPVQMFKDAIAANLTPAQQKYVEKQLRVRVGFWIWHLIGPGDYDELGDASKIIAGTIRLARAALPACQKCHKKCEPDAKRCDHCNARIARSKAKPLKG